MPLTFRRAQTVDLETLVIMLADDELARERESSILPLDDTYRDAFAAIEADPNNDLIVASENETIVGMLQLSFLPGLSRYGSWRAQLENVRVATDRRGEGIGKQLCEWAIDEARARGCRLIQLTTDKRRPAAHRFYSRLGFNTTHEGMKMPL